MPTSTTWRRPIDDVFGRGVSPERPATDHIERLSPEPLFLTSEPHHPDRPHTPPTNPLQGLGLTSVAFGQENHLDGQPDHLYLDQNGSARVATRHGNIHGYSSNHTSPSTRDRPHKHIRSHRESRRSRQKTHTRSGSTIDDLASAAIATSPGFNLRSPHQFPYGSNSISYSPNRPSTSYMSRAPFDEDNVGGPPPKRVKSERLYSTEWLPESERPRSAFERADSTLEEAQLLLFLKQHDVNFKTHSSPPASSSAILAFPPHENHDSLHNLSPVLSIGQHLVIDPIPASEVFAPEPHPQNPPRTQLERPAQSIEKDATPSVIPIAATSEYGIVHGDMPHLQTELDSGQPEEDIQRDTIMTQKPKKPRRVKPEVQAEVCASCERLQRDIDDENLTNWISCNACRRWFHSACVGIKSKADARSVDKYVCKACEPEHGITTYVRKSSRARTAIDYAGLNQGLVKSSVDTSLHHYIQPIKDGRLSFLPDDFARVRPEVLTMEFLESYDGMKRPFVVPACWNPRFGVRSRQKAEKTSPAHPHGEQCYTSEGAVTESPADEAAEEWEEVIDCDQDYLGMVMPRDLTVRKVAELYGPEEPVPVIDVKTQETKGTYTLSQWADYYDEPGDKPIRNVISLEVSESRLGRLIRRPRVVRDLDLEDQVWDQDSRTAAKKRPVQFYCLMSVADSYTDFHIDFGGSSVYYHILKGQKTFFFIPPEDKYLKKYEDWCNSDSQNDTFLGDLCGGNCTRVDLMPGDTAFIPAGWIHAVWTPSDSLVIGGNFLTRLDYELQLKVANIEKMTKVSPKFRYPFFQKVMWYTLIRYLDDDPVPDTVLQDFLDDPDYVFLRAHPVWHELGDLVNVNEPGEPYHNARYYAKAEIHGLTPLRDYLYRTARIHADLPVNDINKKGIDAVKASIPKGHGDPMRLIKTFAIWCAWKTGMVPVPEWVHSEEGTTLEDVKREKVKKAEAVKASTERVSTRRSSYMQTRGTPEVNNVPAKVIAVTPIKPPEPIEAESDSGKKPKGRGNHRGSGHKLACESCRKRRTRCRHKISEVASPSGTAPAPSTRARSQSALSTEFNPPDLATSTMSEVAAEDKFYLEPQNESSPVQEVFASPDIGDRQSVMVNGNIGGNRKSRSKACEECRKSKASHGHRSRRTSPNSMQRRCVHDEHGRVDPAKAAEPSKPRGFIGGKRSARSSDEHLQYKRLKTEGDADEDMADLTAVSDFDVLIDPALRNIEIEPDSTDVDDAAKENTPLLNGIDLLTEMNIDQVAGDKPTVDEISPFLIDNERATSIDSPLTDIEIEDDGADHKIEIDADSTAESTTNDDSPAAQLQHETEVGAAVPEMVVGGTEPRRGTKQVLRQSSRQPKQVERFIPGEHRSPSKSQIRQGRGDRRASSDASAQTALTSTKSRRSSSNTSGTTHRIGMTVTGKRKASREESARPVSRGSTGGESDMDADERLARELQAAENGLRRRQSVRV